MITDNFYVITGAMGSGKSTLLQRFRTLGFQVMEEPARRVLADQRRISNGIPCRDARLFVDLMLSKAIDDYTVAGNHSGPVIFDRGIPDNLGYAALSGFDYLPAQKAAQEYRYNSRVFFVPAWEQIYTNDEERTMSFALASDFGDILRGIYQTLGYDLIEVPCVSAEERVQFILGFL